MVFGRAVTADVRLGLYGPLPRPLPPAGSGQAARSSIPSAFLSPTARLQRTDGSASPLSRPLSRALRPAGSGQAARSSIPSASLSPTARLQPDRRLDESSVQSAVPSSTACYKRTGGSVI